MTSPGSGKGRRSRGKTRRSTRRPEPPAPQLTGWQSDALRELALIAEEDPALTLPAAWQLEHGLCSVKIAVDTTGLNRVPGARHLRPVEEFVISVPADDTRPPHVTVEHERFLGAAHVMSGYELCLYLDPSREWDPGDGIRGVLNRLWRWLEDTASRRFDTSTALYHAVGGVLHIDEGTPTVVVRALTDSGLRPTVMYLHDRSPERLDLLAARRDEADLRVPVIPLRRDLPVGAGQHVLADLLIRLDETQAHRSATWPPPQHRDRGYRLFSTPHRPVLTPLVSLAVDGGVVGRDGCCPVRPMLSLAAPQVLIPDPPLPSTRVGAALLDAVRGNPAGSPQYAVLAVPHPHGGARHLLCLRLPACVADDTREAAQRADGAETPRDLVATSARIRMEWCRVSDERSAVSTRRDVNRPVSVLRGRTVHVWGVGGLGSWIAEFVVRAGAARVVLHDPGTVTGGLLVRQNYTEADVGRTKADALGRRLRALRDDVVVEVLDPTEKDWVEELLEADLLIDATISRTVTRLLDALAVAPARRVMIAQVATDAGSGTLGLATIAAPAAAETAQDATERREIPTVASVDEGTGRAVAADSSLEAYRTFWSEPVSGDEFIPTRGCSIPTFHGSAADLAAVAGGLLNFISLHLAAPASGAHLLALPHSGVAPAHRFLPYLAAASGVSDDDVHGSAGAPEAVA